MRSGMGNLLETDSDVASISDGEKERTDGDGMESEGLSLPNSKHVSTVNSPPSKDIVNNTAESELNKTGQVAHSGIAHAINNGSPSPSSQLVSSPQPQAAGSSGSTKVLCSDNAQIKSPPSSNNTNTSKHITVSPRELPPRSQLIQLKPTPMKPKLSSRSSSEALVSDGVNKQKNPRFVPYEPYRGAVRPMVVESESRRHSRSASDASISSSTIEQAMNRISINDSKELAQSSKDNAHDKSVVEEVKHPVKFDKSGPSDMANRLRKQEQIIEKQTHALSMVKERLKVAEKDNNDLHRENVRLKKLLVDSLSGDILQGRVDLLTNDASRVSPATSDSVDTLSNEIEVWRSKFLSTCVLVEQLTRENGTLSEAVGAASNILKEIKLYSSLSPEVFEEVNTWLRTNRGMATVQNNSLGDDDS